MALLNLQNAAYYGMAADLITRIFTTPRPNHGRARPLDEFGRGGNVDSWDLFHDNDPFRINYLDSQPGSSGIGLFDRSTLENAAEIFSYGGSVAGLTGLTGGTVAQRNAANARVLPSRTFPGGRQRLTGDWIRSGNFRDTNPSLTWEPSGRNPRSGHPNNFTEKHKRNAFNAEWAVRNASFSLTPEVIRWSRTPAGGGVKTTIIITRDQWLGQNGEDEQKQARKDLWQILRHGGQNLEISGWQHQNVQSWRNRDGRGATRRIVSTNTNVDNVVHPYWRRTGVYGRELPAGNFTFSINNSVNLDNVQFTPIPASGGANISLVPTSLTASDLERSDPEGPDFFRTMIFRTPGQSWTQQRTWSEEGTQETTNTYGFRRSNARGGATTTRNEFSAGISHTVNANIEASWPGGGASGGASTTAEFGVTHETSAQRNWSQDQSFDTGSGQTRRAVYTHEGQMTNSLNTEHLRRLDTNPDAKGTVAAQWGGVVNENDYSRPMLDENGQQIRIPNRDGIVEAAWHQRQFVNLWEDGMRISEFIRRVVVNHEFQLNGEWGITGQIIGALNVPITQTVLGHTSTINHRTSNYDIRQALLQAYNHGAMDLEVFNVGENVNMTNENIDLSKFIDLSLNPVHLSNINGVKTADFEGHEEIQQAGRDIPLEVFCTGANRPSNLCHYFWEDDIQENDRIDIDLKDYLPKPVSEMKDPVFLESLGVDLSKDYTINGLAFTNDNLPVRVADHDKLNPYSVNAIGTSLSDTFYISEDFSDVKLEGFVSSYIAGSSQSDHVIVRKGNHDNTISLGNGPDVLYVSGNQSINLGDGSDAVHYFGGNQAITLGSGKDEIFIRKIPNNQNLDFYIRDFDLYDDKFTSAKSLSSGITYALTPGQNGSTSDVSSIDVFHRDELIGTLRNADTSLMQSIGDMRLVASLSGNSKVIEEIDELYDSGADYSPSEYFDKIILSSGLFGSRCLDDPRSFDGFGSDKKFRILSRLAKGTGLPYTRSELRQLAAFTTTDNLHEVVDSFYSSTVNAAGNITDNFTF